MRLSIRHATHYDYDTPVTYALQQVRLRPLDGPWQQVEAWDLAIDGGQIEASHRDHYGNHVDLVSAFSGVHRLTITAHGDVETQITSGVLGQVYGAAPLWHFCQGTGLTRAGDGLKALAQDLRTGDVSLSDLHSLSAKILERVPYRLGQTTAQTTAEEALTIGAGVCQDHTHIFVTAARLAGLPARYVSGYLMMNDRIDQDASHAWAEVHLPGLGWVGFDVSNGYSPDDRYVRLAVGQDAAGAAPIQGLRHGAGDERLIVSLQVQQ